MMAFLTLLILLFAGHVPLFAQSTPARSFVASSRGRVFYRVTCDAWHALSPENLRWFGSADEARAAGYRPSTSPGCAAPVVARDSLAFDSPRPLDSAICTIRRIIDGDTFVCREDDERVRLLLVDSPEISQGPFGDLARNELRRLLPPGTRATLQIDVDPRDRYDRLLAYVFTPDGTMVNEALARAGFVVVAIFPPNVRYVDRIRAAVTDARLARRGLWSRSAFECLPADYRAGRCN